MVDLDKYFIALGMLFASCFGAPIPEELRFTAEEIVALDREMAELEASRKMREIAAEAARAAAQAQAQIIIPIIISSGT